MLLPSHLELDAAGYLPGPVWVGNVIHSSIHGTNADHNVPKTKLYAVFLATRLHYLTCPFIFSYTSSIQLPDAVGFLGLCYSLRLQPQHTHQSLLQSAQCCCICQACLCVTAASNSRSGYLATALGSGRHVMFTFGMEAASMRILNPGSNSMHAGNRGRCITTAPV